MLYHVKNDWAYFYIVWDIMLAIDKFLIYSVLGKVQAEKYSMRLYKQFVVLVNNGLNCRMDKD